MFHFASVFTSSVHQRFCTVLFFFPPTLPPWVILCDVIGWQRGLLGISLAFAYCWFVFLINFTHNCVLFVSGGLVEEMVFHVYISRHMGLLFFNTVIYQTVTVGGFI